MAALTNRDKKTLRLGGIAVAVYLVVFFGWDAWGRMQVRHTQYLKLVEEARKLELEIKPYEAKATKAGKLMEDFQMDPAKLSRETLVAQASAAIQKTAMTGGVGLGPIRESASRGSSREIASIQIQGNGQIQSVMGFLYKLERIGFPIVIDSVQITADPMRPGPVKLNLTLIIVDYSQWIKPEARRA